MALADVETTEPNQSDLINQLTAALLQMLSSLSSVAEAAISNPPSCTLILGLPASKAPMSETGKKRVAHARAPGRDNVLQNMFDRGISAQG